MKRVLLTSKAFIRTAKRLTKRDSSAAADLQAVLELLAEDAFHPSLRTYKLKGKLAKSWACSAGYDLRVVFQIVKHAGKESLCSKQRERMTRCNEIESQAFPLLEDFSNSLYFALRGISPQF